MTTICNPDELLYVGPMDDPVSLIKERLAKSEAKEARAEKAWQAAKNETAEFRTALKVMMELTGAAPASAPSGSAASIAERQKIIVQLLQVGEEDAQAPADLFESYKLLADEEINIDTFRTTIWRMKDRHYDIGWDTWLVKGATGGYWKLPGTLDTRKRHEGAVAAAEAEVDRTIRGYAEDDDNDPPPF